MKRRSHRGTAGRLYRLRPGVALLLTAGSVAVLLWPGTVVHAGAGTGPATGIASAQSPSPPTEPEDNGRKPGHGAPLPPLQALPTPDKTPPDQTPPDQTPPDETPPGQTSPPLPRPRTGAPDPAPPAPTSSAAPAGDHAATPDGSPAFVDAAADVGLDFTHDNGMTGELLFGEVVGAGAALLDYDGDGDLDVFLVQGGPFTPPGDGPPPGDRLFRNLLTESGTLRFEDVTAAAGIDGPASRRYGMGAATGDVDGDGDADLYVTNLGSNTLWRNDGDGTFTDVTAAARADDPRWSTAATFFDADLDGDLDLFVANYVAWTPDHPERCTAAAGYRDYCGPLNYDPVADRLLENRGDGTFTNASLPSGIRFSFGAALGALAHDLAGDPRPEIYVANDASANQLWCPGEATGSGAAAGGGAAGGVPPYADQALERGCALNGAGRPEGSMGVDLGDWDGDGDLDLFLTHVHHETHTLYAHDGAGGFVDVTDRAGLGPPSAGMTGFGTGFLDYDSDGRPDLLVVNGAVTRIPEQMAAGDPHPLHQPNRLLRNLDGRRFADVTATAGPALARSEVSRGAAFGDLDDDGDTDVLITNNGGPVRLLLNRTAQRADDRPHWLGLRLLWTADGRDDHGARVTVELPGTASRPGRRLLRRVRVDGSYLSAHDPRVLVGLGTADAVEAVTVRWSDGSEERFPRAGEPVDRYVTLVRGTAPAAEDAGKDAGEDAGEDAGAADAGVADADAAAPPSGG